MTLRKHTIRDNEERKILRLEKLSRNLQLTTRKESQASLLIKRDYREQPGNDLRVKRTVKHKASKIKYMIQEHMALGCTTLRQPSAWRFSGKLINCKYTTQKNCIVCKLGL